VFKLLISLILIFLGFPIFGGEKTITFIIEPSINSTTVKDEAISALSTQNALFGLSQSIQIRSVKRIENISFFYQSGKLYNDKSTADPQFTMFSFDYYHVWYLVKKEKNFAGIGIDVQTSNSNTVRKEFPNNPTYECFLNTLSPAFRYERRIINKKQKSVILNFSGYISVLGYIVRPSLGTVSPISNSGKLSQSTGDYLTSGKFVSLNDLQFVTSSVSVDFNLSRRLVLSFGYNWKYMHYGIDPVYYQVTHQFYTHVGIKF
jgi:hypothetical protein